MAKILGVDPGSRKTGYGLIESSAQTHKLLLSGLITTKADNLENKLLQIFNELQIVIQKYKPTTLVLEEIFYSVNFRSSMVLAQVRGVIILASSLNNLKLSEYSPREIKQAITGNGNSSKEQLLKALNLIYKAPLNLSFDESDALAAAICYANHSTLNI